MTFRPNEEVPKTGAITILKEAALTIGARAAERDVEQERSMEGTVAAFNALFNTKMTEAQGWAFMVLLKMKRSSVGRFRADDYVDGAAYFALYGEASGKEPAT